MKPWRERCEEEVRTFTAQDALRFWRVGHPTEHGQAAPFNYRLEHTLAVVKAARWLAPLVGANADVVECAAWLHDCRKRLKDPGGKDRHAQDACEAVPDILADTDFPKDLIPAVQFAISRHVGLRLSRRLEPVEAACLWDADKLSKLGASSLVHHIAISAAFQPLTTEDILKRGREWLELAAGIVTSMNTSPARQEAERRFAHLQAHHFQLRREWTDDMGGVSP